MVFTAGLLCVAAMVWILVRTRRPSAKRDANSTGEAPSELTPHKNPPKTVPVQPARRPRGAHPSQPAGDLFEMAPIGYMEIDRDGVVQRVNPQECKLRGLEQ